MLSAAAVSGNEVEQSELSIRHCSHNLSLYDGSRWYILKDLHLHPYKIQLTHDCKTDTMDSEKYDADWVLE